VECQDWVGLSIKFLEGAWARRADDEVCFDLDLTQRQVEHSSHVPKALSSVRIWTNMGLSRHITKHGRTVRH